MRRFLCLLAAAVACLALAPPQQQPQVRTVGHVDFAVYRPVLSPNGRFLAITSRDSLLVMEVASGRHWSVLHRLSKRSYEFDEIDWSPKGDMLAFNRGDDDQNTDLFWTLPIDQNTGVPNGEARRVSTTGGDVVALSPDGQSIVFADYSPRGNAPQRLVLVPARGGRERVLAEPKVGIGSMAWSDDGKWIYYSYSSGQPRKGSVARVPVAGGTAQVVWEALGERPSVIKPGPLIVVQEADRMIRLLDATGTRTKALFRAAQGRSLGFTSANGDATRLYAVAKSTGDPVSTEILEFTLPAGKSGGSAPGKK